MSGGATDLLRMLGSQATPGVAPIAAAKSGPFAAGALDFAKLLSQAQAGQLASGREVSIAKNANVSLTPEQLQRLSAAADQAESQGATRAVVMMDGMALKLDVGMREITGSVDLKSGGVLTGIDSLIEVPAANGAATQPASPSRLSAGFDNASLLSILSKRDGTRAA